MRVLVTGAAGFIGYHTCARFLERGDQVVGVDNLNDYYDVSLKRARLAGLAGSGRFSFQRIELADGVAVRQLFAAPPFDRVVHLAAQVGVRHSLEDPQAYIDSNITATLHVLEGCRRSRVAHLVYASSSSVYGAQPSLPYSEHTSAAHPLSVYAASKRAAELLAHSYSSLYGLPTTGLRLFTVYGPWGRPDMALSVFARAILQGRPIEVFNGGEHTRDFTYVDDAVEGIVRVTDQPAGAAPGWGVAVADPASATAPFRLYNLGTGQAVPLARYIDVLEQCLGRRARRLLRPLQTGDLPDTAANVDDLRAAVRYQPQIPIEVGVARFVSWFRAYYGL